MALLSKKEFAELCGHKPTSLPAYKQRKKIVIRPDGFLDTEDPINKIFIADQSAKKITEREESDIIARIKRVPVSSTVDNPTKHTDAFNKQLNEPDRAKSKNTNETSGLPSYEESVTTLKYLDTKKREREIELLALKEQKLKGDVVPAELITPIFQLHNKSILLAMKNAIDELVRAISKECDLSLDQVASLRKETISTLNSAIEKAAKESASSVKSVIQDFSISRGAGEKI